MSERSKVSVFLSSPNDVQDERDAAERVVGMLNGMYENHVELALERWERRFYEATSGFQEAIAAMATFDLVIGILWKRIGTELPPDRFRRPDGTPFESGTVYEIETALAANRCHERPSVYVFKKTAKVTYTAEGVDEEKAQKVALDGWLKRTFQDEAGRHVAATNEFATPADLETKLADCLVDWLERNGRIPRGPVWDIATRDSPYPGLVPYDRDRSPVFFGRQLAVAQARDELLAADKRKGGLPALFVIGASGSGKSSLARAGLVPRLTKPGMAPGVDLWRSAVVLPAADSLAPLAAQLYSKESLRELAESAQPNPERWARMAAGSPEAAADSVAWALDRAADAEAHRTGAGRKLEARLLLLVDQLESLFGNPGQAAFAKVLRALVGSGRVWLIATLRSDRYQEFQLDPDLLALKGAGVHYDLPPPGAAEIADVVRGPARAADLIFAERDGISLARVLVEAAPHADALPLLQMALKQLYEGREGKELTFAAYEAMGGVEGAIAAHANKVFDEVVDKVPQAQHELDPLVQALVRDVSRDKNRSIRFTARPADRGAFEISASRRQLVEAMVAERLLVSQDGSLRVAHEALLRRWDRARDSLEPLVDAELRRARLRLVAAMAAALVFLLVAVGAVWQWSVAQEQTRVAETELDRRLEADTVRLAEAARSESDEGRAGLGIQLATHALASHDEAKHARPPSRWRAIDALAWSVSAGPLPLADLRHKEWVISAAFSPDGQKVITASLDNTARLSDARDGRQLLVLQHEDAVIGAVFSPDGQKVLTAMGDGPARIWDAATGAQLASLRRNEGEYFPILSPDGRTLLITSKAGTARLLSADDGRELLMLLHGPPIYTAKFSPDGRKIVTVSEDGSTRVWDAATGTELAAFRTHAIRQPVFSSDGRKILAVSRDGTARLLDAIDGREILVLHHQGEVLSAIFSPAERTILTASADGTAQLWDATAGTKLVAFQHEYERGKHVDQAREQLSSYGVQMGSGHSVHSAVFSPGGRQVLTAATDKTARL
jgi:WD40 repeat protein